MWSRCWVVGGGHKYSYRTSFYRLEVLKIDKEDTNYEMYEQG